MPATPALLTKFTIPPQRKTLLPRSHLLDRLYQSSSVPLILLSASAGFGKTTLLSSWASQSPHHVCWLALEDQDNDLTRFWLSFLAALRTRLPMVGAEAEELLQSSQPPALRAVLTTLINALVTLGEEIIFILDDYHVIEEEAIHVSLLFLLEHAPSCFHLVLSSRVDPPLALARWRAHGYLLEIRDVDLRLSLEETSSFLQQTMGLTLETPDVARLAQRTEGWVAGVQLAALAMRRYEDRSAFVQVFSGSQRFILDYIQDEILQRQPLAIQRFLLQTAILSQLSAPLCQALTGEQASQEMLETLERANLFLVPLDEERQWYRFHSLFREALLARLRATWPEEVPRLHRRAAAWYEAQGLLNKAISHALEAADAVYAADLIERFIDPQSFRNEYHTLRRWLARLPDEVLRARPALSFLYAHAVILTSPRGPHLLEYVEVPLTVAEQAFRTEGDQERLGAALTMRAVLTGFQGMYRESYALAQQALPLLPEEERQWRGHALCLLGINALLSGELATARQLLLQSLASYKTSGSLPGLILATTMLGEVCFGRGELGQAASYYQQALGIASEEQDLTRHQLTLETGDRDLSYERLARYCLAAVAYERNQLEEAEQQMAEALSAGQVLWLHIVTPGLLVQVRLLHACGRAEEARQLLNDLALHVHRPEMQSELSLCLGWLAFKSGDTVMAQRWAASITQPTEYFPLIRREDEALLLARLHIAQAQASDALGMLEPLKQEARAQERRHSELRILVLEALAHEALGAHQHARAVLLEAVTLAQPAGYRRPFLEEGAALLPVLKALLPALREPSLAAYVQPLLRDLEPEQPNLETIASSATPGAALPDPLTPQERRVLHLLAEGATNQDIADQLVISRATAKKHVANILSKLGAENRTQAIAHARKYALL